MLKGTTRISIAAVLCVYAISTSTARASLIAHWSADGHADDSVAGRNGTLVNGAGYDSGRFGQAFRLDGANDYVAVADDDVWTFGGDFTLATWVNFDTVKQGSMGRLPNVFMGYDQGPYSRPKWVFAHDGRGRLFFHINGNGSVFLAAPDPFNPTVGAWHHFAITRSTDTYTFYADGASLGSVEDSRTLPNANAAVTFGQAEGLGYLDGRLDDLRIYDSALSDSEIAALLPEPTSIAMLALAGLGIIRKR
jgi:hypothetical protein